MTEPSELSVAKENFDLSDFDTQVACDKGFELELRHPTTNKALGQFITVLGRDSTKFIEIVRERADARTQAEAQALARGDTLPPITADQRERNAVTLLAACTIGFRNIYYKGAELPYTLASAMKLYSEQRWIRQQVDKAIGTLENFMPI